MRSIKQDTVKSVQRLHYGWVIVLVGTLTIFACLGLARFAFGMLLPSMSSALQMINFRLRTAGREAPLIDDDAFGMLYSTSEGVPREIVRLCALATDLLIEKEQDRVTRAMMETVLTQYG